MAEGFIRVLSSLKICLTVLYLHIITNYVKIFHKKTDVSGGKGNEAEIQGQKENGLDCEAFGSDAGCGKCRAVWGEQYTQKILSRLITDPMGWTSERTDRPGKTEKSVLIIFNSYKSKIPTSPYI
ncbi:MAG: hypothetical protein IJT01_11185 [Selenomonadaceae bacterium]|nr:hypothetical protein [Selenomonadaceae bacterium]